MAVRKLTLVYPVTLQDLSGDDRHPQGFEEVKWNPTHILDLRRFEEAIISYVINSPCVKQILNSWAAQNGVILQHWKEQATAMLEAGPQLQW